MLSVQTGLRVDYSLFLSLVSLSLSIEWLKRWTRTLRVWGSYPADPVHFGQALNPHRLCPTSSNGYQIEWLQMQKMCCILARFDKNKSKFQYLGVINVSLLYLRGYLDYIFICFFYLISLFHSLLTSFSLPPASAFTTVIPLTLITCKFYKIFIKNQQEVINVINCDWVHAQRKLVQIVLLQPINK